MLAFARAVSHTTDMVWLIALLCLWLAGLAGYYRGPIRAAFTLTGLLFGLLLAGPLSPLTAHLLPALGLHHPLWRLFVPEVIAFLLVLAVFKIAGNVLHQKTLLHFKYQKDENLFFRWLRIYHRLGFCVGMVNGAAYFFILMMPVYVAGYFTAAVADEGAPAPVRYATAWRAQLHECRLDRVLAAYDPTPPAIYQAAEIIELVLKNPPLEGRLAHYPALLSLSQTTEMQALALDATLQKMLETQARPREILNYPKIQAMVTNATLSEELHGLLGDDLTDLLEFLNTGKSAKYDGEKILGIWDIDVPATLASERKRHPEMTRTQIIALHSALAPMIKGLSLMATPDNKILLRKQNPNNALSTPVGQGTWTKNGGAWAITLPENNPDTTELNLTDDGALHFIRDGHLLFFNKEM
jgi:uncharacterized membrane protein required for colicin V production